MFHLQGGGVVVVAATSGRTNLAKLASFPQTLFWNCNCQMGSAVARSSRGFAALLFDPLSHITPVLISSGYQVPAGKVLVLTELLITTLAAFYAKEFNGNNPTIHLAGSVVNGYGNGYLVDASMLSSAGSGSGSSTPAPGSITKSMLSDTILKYLKPEMLAQQPTLTLFDPFVHPFPTGRSQRHPGRRGLSLVQRLAKTEGKYLTYQWKRNGINLNGETNAEILSISDGNYYIPARWELHFLPIR